MLTHVESPLIPTSVLHGVALSLVLVMALQPQTKEELPFKVQLRENLAGVGDTSDILELACNGLKILLVVSRFILITVCNTNLMYLH